MRPVNLASYQDCVALFNTCRSEKKGKPLPAGYRMHKHNDLYTVSCGNIKIFEVDQTDTVTFTMSTEQLLSMNTSLVCVLFKIIPLMILRKRKGVYTLAESCSSLSYTYMGGDFTHVPKYDASKAFEYFQGIQFNLPTRTCLNPRPDLLDTVIPKIRKQWLRDVKRFKKGLKARAKVGALQGYIEEVAEERKANNYGHWRYRDSLPKWDSPEITQQVLECLRTEKYPPSLLKLLVQTTELGWNQTKVTDSMVLANVDTVFNSHSIHYRSSYGVFGDK